MTEDGLSVLVFLPAPAVQAMIVPSAPSSVASIRPRSGPGESTIRSTRPRIASVASPLLFGVVA